MAHGLGKPTGTRRGRSSRGPGPADSLVGLTYETPGFIGFIPHLGLDGWNAEKTTAPTARQSKRLLAGEYRRARAWPARFPAQAIGQRGSTGRTTADLPASEGWQAEQKSVGPGVQGRTPPPAAHHDDGGWVPGRPVFLPDQINDEGRWARTGQLWKSRQPRALRSGKKEACPKEYPVRENLPPRWGHAPGSPKPGNPKKAVQTDSWRARLDVFPWMTAGRGYPEGRLARRSQCEREPGARKPRSTRDDDQGRRPTAPPTPLPGVTAPLYRSWGRN